MNTQQWEDALSLPPKAFCAKAHISYDDWQRALANQGYVRFTIPKKDGTERVIHSPRKRMKRVQRGLVTAMERWYYARLPDAVYGFIPKWASMNRPRDIMSNAHRHGDCAYLLNIDIDDFFPNITTERLLDKWNSVWPHTHESLLSELIPLLTFQGAIPTGAPTSPLLSNWFALELDEELSAFAKTHELTYTRYVDDLSFSSWQPWPHGTEQQIAPIIKSHGFRLNPEKRKWYDLDDLKVVTGVRFDGGLPAGLHVEEAFVKNMRRCILAYQRHLTWREVLGQAPWLKHKLRFLRQSIEGQLGYLEMVQGVESKLALKLRSEWRSAKKVRSYYLDGYHKIS